jgi:nitroreductase
MDFFEVIRNRHSVRKYKNKPIEEEKMKKILETINSAPSAGDLQAYEIFLVKDLEKKRALAEAALNQDSIVEAPVVLVFCAHPSRSSWRYGNRGEKLYSLQDATIAASYAQLAATALGLASVWIGSFYEDRVLKVIGNPKGVVPVAIIPIGYPAEEPYTTPRRKLKDLVHKV